MTEPVMFEEYETEVDDAWIDYNGHVTDAAYGVIFSAANEAMLESVDLSSAYLARTGRSLYTAECHIWYRAEIARGRVRAASRVLELRDKSLRVRTSLVRDDAVEAAVAEHVYVHVDHALGSAVPFDDTTRVAVAALLVAPSPDERPAD